MTFSTPFNYLSFLWGWPDADNTLTVTTNQGSYSYVPGGIGGLTFASTNGSQN